MNRKPFYIVAVFCVLLALVNSCRKEGNGAPPPVGPYQLRLPPGFPAPVYDFSNNPLTREGIALGRRLFYDPKLSRDSSISCGFCHQQFAAFGHFDHALSHGIDSRIGLRSVPTLFNLIWQPSFMWDGGVNHLEIQPLTPITDENEMGEDLSRLLRRLQGDPLYRQLFRAAFGSDEITSQRLFRALTQFMAIMISAESKYDSVMRREPGVAFTPEEAAGYATYQQKCASCHKEPFFTDFSYRSNGLPILPPLNDAGRMRITGNVADSLKFRVPSLRNVLKSPPYMHDGRFFDIGQVFAFYDHGIKVTSTTDPLVRKGIPLSAMEQRQLFIFLNTLTDQGFLRNKELSEFLIN